MADPSPTRAGGIRDLPIGIVGTFVLLLGLAGTLLWVTLGIGAWRVANGLLESRRHLQRAERTLAAGALKDARFETLSADTSAESARTGRTQAAPLLDVALLAPKIGPMVGELDHFVNAAGLSSRAALGIFDIAQNALQGPQQIIVKDKEDEEGGSRVRLQRLHQIAGTITSIRADFAGVVRELEAISLDNLPRRLRPDVEEGIARARETDALFADAEAGFAILPKFLGSRAPRHYLIGMQNPAELRGTGGAILQFRLLTVDRGRPSLKGGSVYDIDKNRKTYDIPLPDDAWYQRGIEDARRFGNANWSPDWPLSARLTVRYARASARERPDVAFPDIHGVIAVDPLTMRELLPATGSFQAPNGGNLISERTVINFLLHKAYGSYPAPGVRRKVLKGIVNEFYDRMLNPKRPSELVKGMGRSLGEKHMQIWLSEPDEQAFVERMEWDAALDPAADADYLAVIQQNVGGNKLDYFARTSIDARITISDEGDAETRTSAAVANNVYLPQPRWMLGDTGRIGALHRPMVNLYVHDEAVLTGTTVEGERLDSPPPAVWVSGAPPEHLELGKKAWPATLEIPPGETGSITYEYTSPGVVREEIGRKVYRLVVQHQPKVVPEDLTLRVDLPEGASGVQTKGFRHDEGAVVWSGALKEDMVLEVSWQG